jgi:ATP adenylyltransferase/5',5'''-P-1,P-4-tetraphosphate phosphorylase II
MVYHHQRLSLLKTRFVTAIEVIASLPAGTYTLPITESTIVECIASATAITSINQVFVITKPQSIERESAPQSMFNYQAALYHCCVAAVTGETSRMISIVSIHLEAIEMVRNGPRFEQLKECLLNPKVAIDLLKRFVNCRVH